MPIGEPKFPEEWDGRTYRGGGPRKNTYARPWIATQGPFGSVATYDMGYQFQWATPVEAHLNQRVEDLERRIARLETMQRRKPRRKGGRR